MTDEQTVPVRLLWTGGFDSTYRLLELALVERRPVTPIYVVDPDRRSTSSERVAMDRILSALALHDPEARRLVGPIQTFDRRDITEVPDVRQRFERLAADVAIGTQHLWLAELVAAEGWDGVEIGLVGHEHVSDLQAVALQTDAAGRHELVPTWEGDLLRRYSLPLIDRMKSDLIRTAEEHGFAELMGLTWTCHRPVRRIFGKGPEPRHLPCGTCAPCGILIGDGMMEPVPLIRRLRGRLAHLYAVGARRGWSWVLGRSVARITH